MKCYENVRQVCKENVREGWYDKSNLKMRESRKGCEYAKGIFFTGASIRKAQEAGTYFYVHGFGFVLFLCGNYVVCYGKPE